MVRVDAADRLSKPEFQADEDWASYPPAVYTCPVCHEAVGFALEDLDRHGFSSYSNLSPSDAEAASRAVADAGEEFNSFLDFYCPGCQRPVRIYYLTWAGGRFTRGHTLKYVIEASADGPKTDGMVHPGGGSNAA